MSKGEILYFINSQISQQYNHFMQSEQSIIKKTFEMINQINGKASQHSIDVPYIASTREIDFSRAMSIIQSMGLQLHNSHIFYLDFNRKMYVYAGQFPFKQEIFLKYQLFLDSSIKIKYRKVNNTNHYNSNQAQTTPCQQIQKKKKVKQRKIKFVTECVKLWRDLYQTIDQTGKRMHTLETAAKVVGVSKKTLDDYYYQLRQAEYYGFDFEGHKKDKIGVLRQFVKNKLKSNIMCEVVKKEQEESEQSDEIDKYLASSDSDEDRK